ncbi:hypothetical protein K438DRAFT_1714348 [Mycena galopus ATCC 62051]|nr:hypothetical protein K438DRAFT_1714348 [Mycena galopus ATCC 62051]
MNMRVEFEWKSYEMTPKRWADATMAYNARLQSSPGHAGETKHPRALLGKLAEIELKIMQRIAEQNFRSARGNTIFWEKHCKAVSFVKIEAPI